ncbi:MAG TPA: choice-of-anchor J domain-containing protein [Chryseolinea sp.]
MVGSARVLGKHLNINCTILMIFICLVTIEGLAQDRCATVEYTKKLVEKNLIRDDALKFERWLGQRKENLGSRIHAATTNRIPVVVHVIHKGEAIGSGSNISDAQIASQIKVLNNDFRRLNADTVKTPSEFVSLAGRINLEFVLAKQSPDGMVTDGIQRVKGTKNQWTLNDNNTLKALSYWPAEDYLNIWVTDIASTILGYAQFPVSDLAGLEEAETNRLTDGVVLDFRIVGSNQDGSFNLTTEFNRGRTATHEVGHFFGLRHIWGDDEGACSGAGDYVDDTPNQGNSSDGCPSHPQVSCSDRTMFQNYMDYTNDVCMNLYTKQQVERMLTVLANSPRRASLLTSQGLYDPTLVNNDLLIKEILSPAVDACKGTVVPLVTVKNNGLNVITSTRIRVTMESEPIETKMFEFDSLSPQESTQISFAPVWLRGGDNDFTFEILQTNGTADGNPMDNEKVFTTFVPDEIPAPFAENFNTLPPSWSRSNTDGETAWDIVQTGDVDNVENKAAYMKFFQSDDADGALDLITTPVIDLSGATSPFLAFDVAYARYQNHSDGLEVHVLVDCNRNLANSEVIYSKYGGTLATVLPVNGAFVPANANEWRREVLDLSKFIGYDHIQFAFVAVNDKGNNLFIDNVSVRKDVSENIALIALSYPSPIQCSSEIQPVLLVENRGVASIQSFKVEYYANNEAMQTLSTPSGFELMPGEQTTITLSTLSLREGENTVFFSITQPNGFKDIDDSDNKLQLKTRVDDVEDKIPLRKNFDESQPNTWQTINPTGGSDWETTSTNYNQSLYFKGGSNGSEYHRAWFVSPVLNFSNAVSSSLFFDLYCRDKSNDSIKDPSENVFQVLASRDCGKTFDEVLFAGDENSLSDALTTDMVPAASEVWKRSFINLNSLAGEESVRIAFVVANNISSNIYLDNIEFFVSDNPSPFATSELYSIYPTKISDVKSFNLTFNLDQRQAVKYELVDLAGRRVAGKELPDVLNQTYTIDLENTSSGVYLVRMIIDKKFYVSRIVVVQ